MSKSTTYDQRWAWGMMRWQNRAGENEAHLALSGVPDTVCGMSDEEFGIDSGAYNPEDTPEHLELCRGCTGGMDAALEKAWQEDQAERG